MPAFKLTLTGESSLVTRTFSVQEGISQLFELNVVALTHDPDVDLEAIVGQPADFEALSGTTHLAGRVRHWKGVVSYIEQIAVEPLSQTGQSTYAVTLSPRLWLLTQRRNHRIFQHLSIPQIVEKLLGEWKIPHLMKLTGTYEKLEYKVQYGETDYAFMCRLLEEAGISFTFPDDAPIEVADAAATAVGAPSTGPGSLLTFHDDVSSGKMYDLSPILFVDEPNASAQREFVTEVQIGHGVRPGSVVVRDHDFRKPSYALLGKSPRAAAPEDGYEQYVYQPGAFLVEGAPGGDTPVADDKDVARHLEPVGTALAAKLLLAARQGKRQISFSTNVFGLQPAMLFTMTNHPLSELGSDNRLLVTEVTISGGHGVSWRTTGKATFVKDGYRPALVTPKPVVHGVESATVVGPAGEEIYTDEFGRARVQFPWDREGKFDDDSSCWMRVSQGWAGTGFGALNLPRVGQEVLVGFLSGDPDQPIIVGRVFNAVSQVPYKLPDRKSRSTWKSRSYPGGEGFNELMFEDAAGKELVYHQAEKNRYQYVKNDESVHVGHDRERLVDGKEDEVTGGDHRSRVIGGRHVIVEGVKKELVGKDSHLRVQGDEIRSVDGNGSLVAGGEVHVKAGGAVVIEGVEDLTLKGPGGFIRIDALGVTIVGMVVNINSGGAPGISTARGDAEAPDQAQAGPALQAAVAQLQLGDTQAAPPPKQTEVVDTPADLGEVQGALHIKSVATPKSGAGASADTPRGLAFDAADFEKRPNQPHRNEDATPAPIVAPDDGRAIAQTLHHVVPWNQLKAFAMTASANGHEEALKPLLQQTVRTMMANSPVIKGQPMQGSMNEADLLGEIGRTEGERNPEAMDGVVTSLCWMPGNLFQGPDRNLRSEDPDEGFEKHAEPAVGKEPFNRLAQANQQISDYVASPTQEKANSISSLLAPSAARKDPYAYDADLWRPADKPADLKEDVSLYKLKNAPHDPGEDAVFQARAGEIAKQRQKAQAEEQAKQRAIEEYQRQKALEKEESDDEDGGFGGLFE